MSTLKHQIQKRAFDLSIKKGDILLGGRFKNKRMVVEEIGTDELGQITVNGQKLLNFRIEKNLPADKKSKQTRDAELEKTAAKEGGFDLLGNMSNPKLMAALGAVLGGTTGLAGNWLGSKIFGYDDSLASYLAAGAGGATVGGIGSGLAGSKLKDLLDKYQSKPEAIKEDLIKLEKSEGLKNFNEWQKKSILMKPLRQLVGRFVTNVKTPVGYGTKDAIERIKKAGLTGVLKAMWNDEPLYDPKIDVIGGDLKAKQYREPLYRSYFDLPSRMEKFYGVKPSEVYTKKGKTWQFSPDTARGRSRRGELQELLASGKTTGRDDTLGGVSILGKGNNKHISDPWDFYTQKSRFDRRNTGYSSMRHNMSSDDILKESIMHHSRNIIDRLIGNPVTVTQRIITEGGSL
jgi:hypothetical protein